jgi:hypothetical protein
MVQQLRKDDFRSAETGIAEYEKDEHFNTTLNISGRIR